MKLQRIENPLHRGCRIEQLSLRGAKGLGNGSFDGLFHAGIAAIEVPSGDVGDFLADLFAVRATELRRFVFTEDAPVSIAYQF